MIMLHNRTLTLDLIVRQFSDGEQLTNRLSISRVGARTSRPQVFTDQVKNALAYSKIQAWSVCFTVSAAKSCEFK
jgi:hypothetical protein